MISLTNDPLVALARETVEKIPHESHCRVNYLSTCGDSQWCDCIVLRMASLLEAALRQVDQQARTERDVEIEILKRDLDSMQRLYDGARAAEDAAYGWKDRPIGPAHHVVHELIRRVEVAESLTKQARTDERVRCAEIAEAHEAEMECANDCGFTIAAALRSQETP